MNKTIYHLYIFKKIINQLNLLYIYICLYLQHVTSYETHKLDCGLIFFIEVSLAQ
jgi:hypothetical protein